MNAYFTSLKVEKELVWTDKGKTRIDGYADLTERPEKTIELFEKYVPAKQNNLVT